MALALSIPENNIYQFVDRSLAPTGKITLVFSDVQRSTALWEAAPKCMIQALRIHNTIFRKAILHYKGYEVKTEGDSFMVAFSNSLQAVRFCASVQEELLLADWPTEILAHPDGQEVKDENTNCLTFRGLRVRMVIKSTCIVLMKQGVHAGKPLCQIDPVTGRMDYFGKMVNRAARISAVANGGQVLLSDACWQEIRFESELNAIGCFDCLGTYKLRDVSNEVQIYQLLPRSCAFRRFVSLQFLAAEKQDMVVKMSDEALETKINNLFSQNLSLKNQIVQLEDKLTDLCINSSQMSQLLSSITSRLAPGAINIHSAVLSEVRVLEIEFTSFLQKQSEIIGFLGRITQQEETLNKEVSFITEEFSQMEEKVHSRKEMDSRLFKETTDENKYEALWRECQQMTNEKHEIASRMAEMETQLMLAYQRIYLLEEGIRGMPVPSCMDSYALQHKVM